MGGGGMIGKKGTAVVIYVLVVLKSHWLEREIAQWVHYEESIRQPIAP